MTPRDGFVTLAGKRLQQHRRSHGAPLLLGSGLADRLELMEFRFGELKGIALLWEGHTSIKT
jgi:hypothetical protein